jgi:Carboxypeptidase regulatory-like domain
MCGRQLLGKLGSYIAVAVIVLGLLAGPAMAQEKNSGSLRGQVTDPSGAVVAGAAVSVTAPGGQIQKAVSDKQGNYMVHGLPGGQVTVSVSAAGFSVYELPNVIISAGQTQQLDVALGIAVEKQQVTVQSESPGASLDVNPENNASATILKGADLEALSDDPDELEQDLLALAGPSAGPNGGQIYIDGFSNGTLPPKSSIREIRINQNPFSAAYDKPGYGRIEVFTKPGSDKWHGQALFDENNSIFNSRNPYVHGDVPGYHSEIYSGNVSGGLTKKLSIFLNAERRNINDLDAVAETPLTPAGEDVPSPRTRTNVSTRFDYQLTPSNTLTARYQLLKNDQQNLGVGGLVLPSRGYNSDETEHTLQISDTQVLSPHLINEIHFQFIREDSSNTANQFVPAINVLGVFSGGGSTFGQTSDSLNRYEVQNYTSWAVGKHFVKFGGRLRASQDTNIANSNFNGTFTFSGSPAVTPFQAFQNGTPSQYSVVKGNPRAQLSFADAGLYAEDDWKLRPNLTLSYGLRFEAQTGIHDKADFAPRVGVSWGLGNAKSTPKTVLRFGYGIFYDRFTYDLIEQAQRLNGVTEEQFVVTNPTGYPNPPCTTIIGCSRLAGSSPTIYQINPDLRAPYTMQSAVSLERQLGKIGTVSVTYLNSRGFHQLILENANAPCAVGSQPSPACLPGERPLAAQFGNDNLYQYNSEAIFKQNQLIANVNIRVSQKISLIGYYTLNYANSDTGGASSSPSNQYNLSQDYGRASFDIRHRVFLSGSASLAHNIRISPFVLINSGAPFNITTGQDNGDTFFNQRPSFGTPGAPGVITNQYGSFKPNPTAGERPIPINYGNGFANVTVNMRLSKTFGFGQESKGPNAAPDQGPGGGGGHGGHGGPGGGFGGPRGMGGIFAPSTTSKRYNLTLTMTARNIFNTWNPGSPIGNLLSPRFGQTNSLAGGPFSSAAGAANRRVDFQAVFAF